MSVRAVPSGLHTGNAYTRYMPAGVHAFPAPAAGGTPVEVAQVIPVEYGLDVQARVELAADWVGGVSRDVPVPVEILHLLTRSAGMLLDHQVMVSVARGLPTEVIAPLTSSAELQIEQALEIIRAHQVPTEQLSGLSAGPVLPVLWSGALAVDLAVDLPLDWLMELEKGASLPAEYDQNIAVGRPLPADHQADLATSSEIRIEHLGDLLQTAELPVLWTGMLLLEFLSPLPVDIQAGLETTPALHIDSVAMIVAEREMSVEQLGEMIAARDIQADFVAVIARDDVLPVAWDGVSGFIAGVTRIFKRRAGPATRFADRPDRSWFPVKGARGRGVIFKRRK